MAVVCYVQCPYCGIVRRFFPPDAPKLLSKVHCEFCKNDFSVDEAHYTITEEVDGDVIGQS